MVVWAKTKGDWKGRSPRAQTAREEENRARQRKKKGKKHSTSMKCIQFLDGRGELGKNNKGGQWNRAHSKLSVVNTFLRKKEKKMTKKKLKRRPKLIPPPLSPNNRKT